MFLLPIKLDRVSFETKGRQNLQKTADFVIEFIVFCPLVPPSWFLLLTPLPLCMRQQSMSHIYVTAYDGMKLAREQNNFQKDSGEFSRSQKMTRKVCFRAKICEEKIL